MTKKELGHVYRKDRVITFNCSFEDYLDQASWLNSMGQISRTSDPRDEKYKYTLHVKDDKDFTSCLRNVAEWLGDRRAGHYSFQTKTAEEIDIQRICDENPLADAVLYVYGDCQYGLLLINNKFLSKFKRGDGLTLGGDALYDGWGSHRVQLYHRNGSVVVAPRMIAGIELEDWRCDLVRLPVDSVIEQLKRARKFQRQFISKVHRL